MPRTKRPLKEYAEIRGDIRVVAIPVCGPGVRLRIRCSQSDMLWSGTREEGRRFHEFELRSPGTWFVTASR